ncbi:MAG: hypothetical protein D6782_08910 [Alphaproteobacteria bacterium]|nr:MAG: hypothetical protein D6782_08910 [Alphaproteobacteria bacterium]
MSDRDLAAAWDIEMACRDLGGQACSPTTQARCAAASRRFQIWVATLSDIGLPAGPVLDVVLDSRSLAEIDRRWRRRKGWARKVIAMALAEYPDVFAPAWSMARPAQNCAPAPLRHAFCLQEAV